MASARDLHSSVFPTPVGPRNRKAVSYTHLDVYKRQEYLEGNAVNKDTVRAADWFTKSAEAGNQYAQYMLGTVSYTHLRLIHEIP